jgi:hypothetical protein
MKNAMALQEIYVKGFDKYLAGDEIEAVCKSQPVQEGDRVLVFKDSVAATIGIPVPRGKEDRSIGVEGIVTHAQVREPGGSGSRNQLIRIRKI